MNKLKLPNVTLICADDLNIEGAIDAIEICKYYADFGDIKFLTDANIEYEHKISIPHMGSYSAYSSFIFNKLNDFVDTDFCLVVQHDGFILNPNAWTDEYFEYDYIGALLGPKELPEIVGNGGFSLRSKKLLQACQDIGRNYNDSTFKYSEDLLICYYFRDIFTRLYDIKIAPPDLANQFSTERSGVWTGSFGWHNPIFVDIFKDGWQHPFKPNWTLDKNKYIYNITKNKI